MLTISRNQWQLMEERFAGVAAKRVAGHLRENYAEACEQLTAVQLQHLADSSVREALASGFCAYRDYCAYASLSLLDPGFEQRPSVQMLLREAPAPDDSRMSRILFVLQMAATAQAAP